MSELEPYLPQMAAAYLVYLVAVLSPGPANYRHHQRAILHGRRHGLVLAWGVFAGSFTWAMAAALGLSIVLSRYGHALQLLKIAGGFYMLFLAYKASRSLFSPAALLDRSEAAPSGTLRIFLTGYAIHLTNPKAIFGWLAIISLGLPASAPGSAVAVIVGGCLSTSFLVFTGYALMFSTERAARLYRAARRPLDAAMALIFGAAGARMLSSTL